MKKCAYLLVVYLILLSPFTYAQTSKEGTESAPDTLLLVDGMEKRQNARGGRCAVYVRSPSRVMFSKVADEGKTGKGLKIIYDKKAEGGPYGNGGWCGYYTIVRKGKNSLDVSSYQKLTLWVKGEKGGENFKIGVADQQGEMIDDSTKSDEIIAYLPEGKITTEWQKADIPLEDVFVDWEMLHSLSISFETDCFESGGQKGRVFIDDIQFEQ